MDETVKNQEIDMGRKNSNDPFNYMYVRNDINLIKNNFKSGF